MWMEAARFFLRYATSHELRCANTGKSFFCWWNNDKRFSPARQQAHDKGGRGWIGTTIASAWRLFSSAVSALSFVPDVALPFYVSTNCSPLLPFWRMFFKDGWINAESRIQRTAMVTPNSRYNRSVFFAQKTHRWFHVGLISNSLFPWRLRVVW